MTICVTYATIIVGRWQMKVLVIGGGMAGLTYAIVACKNGHDVTVAERNNRVGKKIAVTGNGKCNIGNTNVGAECFNRSAIVDRVLGEISVSEYSRFLQSCGIYTYSDDEGRMYPLSDSASNVVDCLRYQLDKYGGKLLCDTQISRVEKRGAIYQVNISGQMRQFDKVVIACGSGSQAIAPVLTDLVPQGCITKLSPSLVPIKVTNMDGRLNGLRAKADVTLLNGDKIIGKQSGEVQFKEYGLSGICVFNLSAIIARNVVNNVGGNYKIVVDVVPRMSVEQLATIISKRLQSGEQDKLFYGILHNKLAEYVVKQCDTLDANKLAHTAKHLVFKVDRLLDWSMSQVTSGGIAESSIDLDTLALSNGVVALGEVLNVDGVCGGNNLFFAAASALYTFNKEQREAAYLEL